MSISFITGKPGGGKGLTSMKQIIDELVLGDRPIITNLPVHVDQWHDKKFKLMSGLRVYLQKTYGKDFDVGNRVHVVPDDAIRSFFLWRVAKSDGKSSLSSSKATVVMKQDEERIIGFDTTLTSSTGGHLYVVDEAWNFFGSRSWQKTGEALLFYCAQHRHFGDDVLIVTQHTKQIDPAVQRVAQDFWVVKNHSKLSIGMFRQPSVFSISIFENPPTGAQMSPMARRVFQLDAAGIAQCYDTSAGVGISGRAMADVGARKKGLPWWGLIVVVVMIGLGAWYLLRGGGWLVGHWIKGSMPAIKTPAVPVGAEPAVLAPEPKKFFEKATPSVSAPAVVVPKNDGGLSVAGPASVWCTGFTGIGGKWVVYLSDGRVAKSSLFQVQNVGEDTVKVFGREYEVRAGVATSERSPWGNGNPIDYASLVRPSAPVNDAQVTVIGDNARKRAAQASSGSFSPSFNSFGHQTGGLLPESAVTSGQQSGAP